MVDVRFPRLLAIVVAALTSCGRDSTAPAAPATRLAFTTQPSITVAGAKIAPAIVIVAKDDAGNVATSFTGAVALSIGAGPGGATLAGTATVAAVAGVATFGDVSINTVGARLTLRATSGQLTPASSDAFDVTAGPPVQLTKSGGDQQSAFISLPLAARLSVTVTDAFANPVADAVVNWTVATGGGSVSAAASTTNQFGLATITWTLGVSPGSESATASLAGSNIPSVTFTATATAFSFASLTAGQYFTCGLSASGGAYCWGFNADGELGDSTKTFRWTPSAVQGGLAFANVAGGYFHACALTTNGAAYCWGDNGSGESSPNGALGDGTTVQRLAPTAITGGIVFAELAASVVRTCGLASAGAAYCWGVNTAGQLGDGTTVSQRLVPTAVTGNLTFTSIVAGGSQGCGLVAGGAAYCWGANSYGELGDGTTTTRVAPTPVGGGMTFASLAAGYTHTCGLTSAGAAYCWGYNGFGNLGDGTTTRRLAPTPVTGGLRFTALVAGETQTCGLTAGGAAYCWGLNQFGELGDGTTTQRLSPALVSGGASFASLAAGRLHTCGRTLVGAVYCWGRNTYGELGDGTNTDRTVPTAVIP
jgi:alpha-tubulin suppressor-like RCC1 family protein